MNTTEGELVLKEIVLDQEWLKVKAILHADSSVELRLTADAATAGAGQHQAEIQIVSNDRIRPVVSIPVFLQVDT